MVIIDEIDISWIGHDGFRIKKNSITIYIDPYKISKNFSNKKDADLILISHNHFDHLSIEDINNLINKETNIVCAKECIESLKSNYPQNKITGLDANQSITVRKISIKGIEAYNTNKKFHPKEDKKIGFIIDLEDTKIYHSGDTDIIPEMENLNPDIALVPVSGTYVMTAKEASKAINELIRPKKMAIPMHYDSIVGNIKDAEEFCKEVNVCKTTILERE